MSEVDYKELKLCSSIEKLIEKLADVEMRLLEQPADIQKKVKKENLLKAAIETYTSLLKTSDYIDENYTHIRPRKGSNVWLRQNDLPKEEIKWYKTWGKVVNRFSKLKEKDIHDMVKKGADVNHVHVELVSDLFFDLQAWTDYPLKLAAESGNIEVYRTLRKYGAKPKRTLNLLHNGKIEYTPFLTETVGAGPEILEYILKNEKISVPYSALEKSLYSIREFRVLLKHADLQKRPNIAKKLLKRNLIENDGNELIKVRQALILQAIKPEFGKNQNSKVAYIKTTFTNLGR